MAAATAIIGTTLAVAGAAKSFSDASKQEKARKEANAAADIAMNDARKKLDENFYEGLDINLKSFEQERNALAGVGQQLVQAGQEGERGAGAMAGRVMLGVQKAEQEITNRQIGSMENLEKLVAGEESRLQGQRVALDLGEAEGAQLAARDAAAAKNAAITQGVTQLGQAGMGLYESSELYGQKKQPNTTVLTNTGVNIRNDTLNNLSEEALFNQIKPANQIFGTNDISAFSGGQTRVA
jgi:hypothetical protein